MANIISQRIRVKGLDIHYLTCGSGEPLIILHGGGDGARAWKRNVAVLSRKYTIYVPDLPGFGSSESLKEPYYIPEMVEFVNDFAEAIGLDEFYLMGHSFGGGIALHYALKYPAKLRKLVLVSSLCLGKEIAWWVRIFSNRNICTGLGKAVNAVFRGVKRIARYFGPWEIVEPISKTSMHIGSGIATLTEQTIVLLSQLPTIMVPTLVLWGSRDAIVPSAHAYAAAELIPDCQVRIFQNCGHSVYREKLREFSKVLSGFLD